MKDKENKVIPMAENVRSLARKTAKKDQELEYARLFLQSPMMQPYGYRAVANENESEYDEHVDVYAESDTYSKLNLQVKIIDRGYMPDLMQRVKELKRYGEHQIRVRDLKPVEWAKAMVADCATRYSPDVRKEIVLLLCLYYGGELNQEYAQREFANYENSDFKGIYMIDPPRDLTNSTRVYAGQITPIKKLSLWHLLR